MKEPSGYTEEEHLKDRDLLEKWPETAYIQYERTKDEPKGCFLDIMMRYERIFEWWILKR